MKSRVVFSSATPEWPTPKALLAELDREFHFDLDPCPIGGTDDGLATLLMPWSGRRVFANVPYGPRIGRWLARGLEAEIAVFLLPARTDVQWFHCLVLPFASEIRFIRGRLKFGDSKTGAPFPSMLVIYRRDSERTYMRGDTL